MMDTKLKEAFNEEVNRRFYGAYLFFAMSTFFDEIAMFGFNDFMRQKSAQKLENAHKIYDYLILRDEKLVFLKIDEPDIDWINVTDVFSAALAHEELAYLKLNELYKIALEAGDFAGREFISELLKEQERNLGCFRKILFRAKSSNIISCSLDRLEDIVSKIQC